MKNLFILFLFFLISFSASAQYEITKDSTQNQYLISKLDSMGIDNNHYLNQYEGEYFNTKFQKERKDFDFSNKKVAFFNRGALMNKTDYYSTEKDRHSRGYSSNQSSLIIFNEMEKINSSGFDAIVIYWSKMYRSTEYYIKKIKTDIKN